MDDHCHVEPVKKEAGPEELTHLQRQQLFIWGMGCPNCVARVRNSLLSLKGVVEAHVDHVSGQGFVLFNPTIASVSTLLEAVARAGSDGRHIYRAEAGDLQAD